MCKNVFFLCMCISPVVKKKKKKQDKTVVADFCSFFTCAPSFILTTFLESMFINKHIHLILTLQIQLSEHRVTPISAGNTDV